MADGNVAAPTVHAAAADPIDVPLPDDSPPVGSYLSVDVGAAADGGSGRADGSKPAAPHVADGPIAQLAGLLRTALSEPVGDPVMALSRPAVPALPKLNLSAPELNGKGKLPATYRPACKDWLQLARARGTCSECPWPADPEGTGKAVVPCHTAARALCMTAGLC
jgi:hypothetical protein